MTAAQFIEIALVALVAGAFGGMLGLGGGIILVPALIAFMDVPREVAVASSLVSLIATSGSASLAYLNAGLVNVGLALYLEVATTVGAIAGTFLALRLSDHFVAGFFAVTAVYAALTIVAPRRSGTGVFEVGPDDAGAVQFYDPERKAHAYYCVRGHRLGLAAGGFAGVVSAVLGIGGGLIMVPFMVSRMGLPLRAAVATSAFMIGVTAVATSVKYFADGYVDLHLAAACTVGVLAGGRIGARLAGRAKSSTLRWLFAAVLGYTAVTMARRAGLPF